jgi:poly-gamma-glutamate synthesis protein (capsule biosynthesis protein)
MNLANNMPGCLRFGLIGLSLFVFCACQPHKPSMTSTPEALPATAASSAPAVTATKPASTHTPTITPTAAAPTLTPTATDTPMTRLLFTGVIVPARCVQAALDANGNPDFPYEEVHETIEAADLSVGVFNATMSDQVEHTGCVWTYQLVGSPQNADALERAGFDVMSVATNHIKDCGRMKGWCNQTFFDTLENLKRVGIAYLGGGENLEAAMQPLVIPINGVRFGFVALGDSKMDESVFATASNPGIARLDEENMRTAIAAARQVADVVIALPHWGSEDNFVPNWNQRTQAKQLVAAGADLVVGNHTHVVQAIQEIEGVPVFYGLGNFVFDQWYTDHRQGVILIVKFKGTQYLGYELIPINHTQQGRVSIAEPEEAQKILKKIDESSEALR